MSENSSLLPSTADRLTPGEYITGKHDKDSGYRHTYKLDRRCRGVRSVSVSHDNKYLVITYEENTPRIRIMDLQKFELLPYDYDGHTASVRLTSISQDNKVIHTASWDGSSRRYEIETGACTLILSGFGRCPSCFLDPDQRYLFTASYDSDCSIDSSNTGRCWDLSTGKLMAKYKHTKGRLTPEVMDILYDEGKVFTGSDDGCLNLWALKGGEPLKEYFSIEGSIRKLAVSLNYIAAACTDHTVRVCYKHSGEGFRCFHHTESDIRTVLISVDETKIWSATENGTVYCFSLVTGERIFRRKIHALWIWSMALMQKEQILVTGSGDGCVAFLSAVTGKILARFYNLPKENDILFTCPPDKTFPHGFFYTSSTNLIGVVVRDKETGNSEELSADDPVSIAYINKLNLKNLIIARLKNGIYYESLTRNHLRSMRWSEKSINERITRALKA
jgi:WD40 repeat protein